MESPSKVITTPIPAAKQSIPAEQQVRQPQMAVRPALCEDSLSKETVQQVQTKLQEGGYHHGALDGLLGEVTRASLTRYQEANQLASGALTLETMQKLGLR